MLYLPQVCMYVSTTDILLLFSMPCTVFLYNAIAEWMGIYTWICREWLFKDDLEEPWFTTNDALVYGLMVNKLMQSYFFVKLLAWYLNGRGFDHERILYYPFNSFDCSNYCHRGALQTAVKPYSPTYIRTLLLGSFQNGGMYVDSLLMESETWFWINEWKTRVLCYSFQKFGLQFKATLENVTNVRPVGEDFRWFLKVGWRGEACWFPFSH